MQNKQRVLLSAIATDENQKCALELSDQVNQVFADKSLGAVFLALACLNAALCTRVNQADRDEVLNLLRICTKNALHNTKAQPSHAEGATASL